MNFKKMLKIIGIIALVIIGFLLLNIFFLAQAVKDSNIDFVDELNIEKQNCSEIKKGLDSDSLCGHYFARNKQYHCRINISNYLLNNCGDKIG